MKFFDETLKSLHFNGNTVFIDLPSFVTTALKCSNCLIAL